MDGGFGAQDAAFGGIGLIVELYGVAVDAVLDTYSFGPAFEVTDHFSGEVLAWLSARGNRLAQKTEASGAGEGGHGVVIPARIKARWAGGVVKIDIGGLLVLVNGPKEERGCL